MTAEPGRLRVREMSPGVDGSIVLRYHFVPSLRARPPVPLEPGFEEGDPVPFIGLRPPPGSQEVELEMVGPFSVLVVGWEPGPGAKSRHRTDEITSCVAFSREGVCRARDRLRTAMSRLSDGSRAIVFWFLWATIVLIAAAFYYPKAADHRSAFVRWRPQVLKFWDGVNIYDKMLFPNPPIMPITLGPLMALPPVAGAMTWFGIKVALTTVALSVLCLRMVNGRDRPFPAVLPECGPAAEPPPDPGRSASRQHQPADPVPDRGDVRGLAEAATTWWPVCSWAWRSRTRSRRRCSFPISPTSDRGGPWARRSWGWPSSCWSSRA